MAEMAKKTTTTSATPAEPPTYTAWKAAAALELTRRHGIKKIIVREKQWREAYIRRMTPTEAADRAAADYATSQRPVDRVGRRKR
jgi:hypothetical protein